MRAWADGGIFVRIVPPLLGVRGGSRSYQLGVRVFAPRCREASRASQAGEAWDSIRQKAFIGPRQQQEPVLYVFLRGLTANKGRAKTNKEEQSQVLRLMRTLRFTMKPWGRELSSLWLDVISHTQWRIC